MSELLLIASTLLGFNLALSLLAMLRQPAASDRMLTAQLLSTNSISLMLLLALSQEQAGLIDVALVLALLATVVVIAFTRREKEPHHA